MTKQKMSKKTDTRSGVRTHMDICPLDLKSNALTTRPSWLSWKEHAVWSYNSNFPIVDCLSWLAQRRVSAASMFCHFGLLVSRHLQWWSGECRGLWECICRMLGKSWICYKQYSSRNSTRPFSTVFIEHLKMCSGKCISLMTAALYCRKKFMHCPGIQPGSQEWESCMIPLHQQCLCIFIFASSIT